MSSVVRIRLQTPPANRRMNKKVSPVKEKSEQEGEIEANVSDSNSREALHRGYNKYMFHHKKINLSLRQLKEEMNGLQSSGNSLSRQMATMFRKFKEMRESEKGFDIDDVEFEFNYDCDSDADSQTASSACSCNSPIEESLEDEDDDDVFLSDEKLSQAASRDSGYDSRWSGLSAEAEEALVKILRKVSQSRNRKSDIDSSSSSSDDLARSETEDDVMTDASFCSQCSCCPPSPGDSDTWSGPFCSPRISSSSDNCGESTDDEFLEGAHAHRRRSSVVHLSESPSTLQVPTLNVVDQQERQERQDMDKIDEIKFPQERVLEVINSRSSPDGSPATEVYCSKTGESEKKVVVHNLGFDGETETKRPSPIGENINILIKEDNTEHTRAVNIKKRVKTFEKFERKEVHITRTRKADYSTVTTLNKNSLVGKRIVNLITGREPDEIPCITSENMGKEACPINDISPQTKRKSCLVVVSLRNPKEASKNEKEKKPTYTTSKAIHEKSASGTVKSTLTFSTKKTPET